MKVALINKPGKVSENRIFRAIIFYGELLLSKKLLASIELRVVFIDNLSKEKFVDASCIWDDDNSNPREFTIEIDSALSVNNTLSSLAHEMVHLKQYAKGEMKDMLRGPYALKWHGKPFNEANKDYWDLPWEIEAYGREIGLLNRFLEHWRNLDAKDKKAQSYCANTSHTFILKKGGAE